MKLANRKRGEGLPRDVEEMRIREIDRTKQKNQQGKEVVNSTEREAKRKKEIAAREISYLEC